ncbi:MAG: hypothetical protein R6V35_00840 [Candidatus Nanohaloarchaea archaeon]
MVKFEDGHFYKQDHFFVKEDPNRIYRGLKDLLVNEFDVDRIEEMRNEFSVSSPKDKTRLYAYKEKSPHTLIEYNLEFRAKSPKMIYKQDRDDDILKARVTTSATVISHYPGRNQLSWEPKAPMRKPFRDPKGGGLMAEHESRFQRSKFYKVLVGIWHNKFYHREIERYEEESEEVCLRIHDLMREKFGVEKSIGQSGRSEYSPTW